MREIQCIAEEDLSVLQKVTAAEIKKLNDAYDKLRKQIDTLNTSTDELVVSAQQANRKNEAFNSQPLVLQQKNRFSESEAERSPGGQ